MFFENERKRKKFAVEVVKMWSTLKELSKGRWDLWVTPKGVIHRFHGPGIFTAWIASTQPTIYDIMMLDRTIDGSVPGATALLWDPR